MITQKERRRKIPTLLAGDLKIFVAERWLNLHCELEELFKSASVLVDDEFLVLRRTRSDPCREFEYIGKTIEDQLSFVFREDEELLFRRLIKMKADIESFFGGVNIHPIPSFGELLYVVPVYFLVLFAQKFRGSVGDIDDERHEAFVILHSGNLKRVAKE